jgi:hypothetical protein
MRLLSKAAWSLKAVLEPSTQRAAQDIVWTFLYRSKLSQDIRRALVTADTSRSLAAKATSRDRVLDCSDILGTGVDAEQNSGKYTIDANANFTGEQVLAALLIVFATYFWIDKKWLTDVTAYEATIP